MKKISVIKETLSKYEGYKIEEIELISTIIGETAGSNLYNAGLTNLEEIHSYGAKELAKLTGLRKDKIIQLLALYELCKRNIRTEPLATITAPKDLFNYCKDMMYEDQEVLRLICLDIKNQVIWSKDMFKGGISTSIVDVRLLLKEAIRLSSASIAVAHNHPSGEPSPSKDDLNITTRLNESCKIIGVNLLDHVIVGKDRFFSFKDKGIL